ncbi:MAG TPA: hypothetical protein DCR00_12265, partial [Gammaproteobacteria bacterium]|nr:hypothetical protein [Gammaproteobacteria bacterium]
FHTPYPSLISLQLLQGANWPRIIALAASFSGEDRKRCEIAGIDDFLGQPPRLKELCSALN